jgi:negative regulator of flagellin synthesis FlgM
MKIIGDNPFVKLDAYVKNVQNNNKVGVTKDSSREVSREDQVVLSERATQILEARKRLGSIPDIREEKVALIKEQLENGSYDIDGQKIANKMLRESIFDDLA